MQRVAGTTEVLGMIRYLSLVAEHLMEVIYLAAGAQAGCRCDTATVSYLPG